MKLQSKDFHAVNLAATKALANDWLEKHGPKVISVETVLPRLDLRQIASYEELLGSYPIVRIWYDAEEEIPESSETPVHSYSEVNEPHQPDPF